MEVWDAAKTMDAMLAKSKEPKIDTPEYFAILYGAIDCCGQAVGADEETTMLTVSVFFNHNDKIGGIEYFKKIFDTARKPELLNWIIESGQAVKDLIKDSKDPGQALIPLAEKYRIAVSDREKTKKKGYEGEMKDGKPHGRGIYIWSSGNVYEGEWKEGDRDGKGTLNLTDGSFYEGEWKDNFMQGQGTKTWPNGQKYEGEWKEGEYYGQGTHTWSNGNVYEGEWKEGEKDGQGEHTWSNGGKYVGEWKSGEMWNGTFSDKDGNNIDYENGLQMQSDNKTLLDVQPTLFNVVDDQDTSED